jgi:hypothetical protein
MVKPGEREDSMEKEIKTYTTPKGNVIKVVQYEDTKDFATYIATKLDGWTSSLTTHRWKQDAIAQAQFLHWWVEENFG